MEAAVASAEGLGTKASSKDSAADAMRALTRLAYTSAYVCSYIVAYAAVFIANALPSESLRRPEAKRLSQPPSPFRTNSGRDKNLR
jgi:hypothetical protein